MGMAVFARCDAWFSIDPSISPDESFDSDSKHEVEDETHDDPTSDPHPEVSLSTVTTSSCLEPLGVKGIFRKTPMSILIDSGTSINFLDISIAR